MNNTAKIYTAEITQPRYLGTKTVEPRFLGAEVAEPKYLGAETAEYKNSNFAEPPSEYISAEIIGRPCLQPEEKTKIPLFACSITAGFPSPAEDWVENIMDMNELLVKRPAATFLLRVRGDSMTGAGIFDGDILLVDRSITAHEEHVVIAAHGNELTVKRLRRKDGRLWLVAENPNFKPILVTEDVRVWGVVTSAIRRF